MRWKRYPAYRDSGVDWLGEVPEHWTLRPMRFSAAINPSPQYLSGLTEETPVSFLPMAAIREHGGHEDPVIRPLGETEGYTPFCEGDVLVAKITPCFENVKGTIAIGLENGIGFGTTELVVLRPFENTDRGYLFYVTISQPFRLLGEASMTGAAGQKRIANDFIRDFPAFWPGLSEQQSISSFLDQETSRIDTLISRKQRQLELLEEKRTALITNAVSKGLDPNVKTKHSGVEWLGKVPEHWRVASAKWVYEIQLGKMLQNQPNCPSDKAVPYLKAVHVNWGSVSNDELPTMWATLSDVNSHGVRQGDLLVCEGGEPGRAGIVGTVPDGCIMQNSLHRVRAENQYDLVFLLYVLWKANKCGYLETECNKATITHFTGEKFGNLRIPWPPGNERGLIADFLDNETNRINDLKDKIQESIDTLQEYRSALISAAVTGQIDVREEVV